MTPSGIDLLVVGSGVAGLSAAVHAAAVGGLRVAVLTKAEVHQSATRWAQGGVAAVLDTAVPAGDSTELHLADTLAAGVGLCDADAVRVLVEEGPARVRQLIRLGAMFDRGREGQLLLAREGGHSHPRVVHAGGAATGAEIERALVEAVQRSVVALLEGWFAVDLVVEGGRCRGVVALDPEGRRQEVRAAHVLLAAGGAGQLFAVTTNPVQATGDGAAMALRAGVAVADVEFMQFHPTALHHPAMPRPLLSEALRGHGARLRDVRGERFVDELAPRDVVSRAMTARMLEEGSEHLWLDATGLERFAGRFPTIAASLRSVGLDPATDWLPVAPAAHYLSGGVVTDLDGATALSGLWAVGEAACTGVHGANRLASNSLLEGMVFAPRAVDAILAGVAGPQPTGAMRATLEGAPGASPAEAAGAVVPPGSLDPPPPGPLGARPDGSSATGAGGCPGRRVPLPRLARRPAPTADAAPPVPPAPVAAARAALQRALTDHAGVLRDDASLAAAAAACDRAAAVAAGADGPAAGELANLALLGRALVAAADARRESRGAHVRTDAPGTHDAFRLRLVLG